MKKPSFWAEQLRGQVSVTTPGCRVTAVIRTSETPERTLRRIGFVPVGGFCIDATIPGRQTAVVVRR